MSGDQKRKDPRLEGKKQRVSEKNYDELSLIQRAINSEPTLMDKNNSAVDNINYPPGSSLGFYREIDQNPEDCVSKDNNVLSGNSTSDEEGRNELLIALDPVENYPKPPTSKTRGRPKKQKEEPLKSTAAPRKVSCRKATDTGVSESIKFIADYDKATNRLKICLPHIVACICVTLDGPHDHKIELHYSLMQLCSVCSHKMNVTAEETRPPPPPPPPEQKLVPAPPVAPKPAKIHKHRTTVVEANFKQDDNQLESYPSQAFANMPQNHTYGLYNVCYLPNPPGPSETNRVPHIGYMDEARNVEHPYGSRMDTIVPASNSTTILSRPKTISARRSTFVGCPPLPKDNAMSPPPRPNFYQFMGAPLNFEQPGSRAQPYPTLFNHDPFQNVRMPGFPPRSGNYFPGPCK